MAKLYGQLNRGALDWCLVLVWMGVIFYFSSLATLPTAQIFWWDFAIKKSAHMTEYAVLFWLIQRALGRSAPDDLRVGWKAVMLGLIYAITDEWHQSWTPNRHPQLTDIGFDVLGMWTAFLRTRRLI